MTVIKSAEGTADMSRKWLKEVVDAYDGNLTKAAEALGTYKQRLDALIHRKNKNHEEIMILAGRARKILKKSKSAMFDKMVDDK
jgi:hypothetical protein